MNKTEIPHSNRAKYVSRIRDLIDDMISFGLTKSREDFAGVNFGFTVVDSAENPIPFASVIIDLDSLGRIKIGSTNQSGQITLAFTKQMIENNPGIFGEKNGKYYGVSFNMTASANGNITKKAFAVNLNSLDTLEAGKDLLYFSKSVSQKDRDLGVFILKKERNFIRNFLGAEPIPWGMALVDTTSAVYVSPDKVNYKNSLINVFPFSIKEDNLPNIFASNLHEWTEQTLDFYYSHSIPRWIADGLSEYIKIAFARSLTPNELKRIGIDKEWINTLFKKGKKKMQERITEHPSFDLLDWQYAGLKYKLTNPSQPYGYPTASSFWYYITKKCGDKIVREMLEYIKDYPENYNTKAVKYLKENCDSSVEAELKNYPTQKVIDYLNEVEKELLNKL